METRELPRYGVVQPIDPVDTKFQSIEHCRNIEGPFYHEFLLLKLTDGAVCRVERVGDGSRTNAIRYIGCPAHDLIQWFSSSDYEAFSVQSPSERVAEVDLGQEFDILDVLAVCYSIQKYKRCCAYTLQRYNCYFLCLAVLAVLTRRAASWETKIEAEQWESCLDSMLNDLRNLSVEESRKHPILSLCAYIEPENPQRAQFVFNILREYLKPEEEGFMECQEVVGLTLWTSDWESTLQYKLAKSIEAIPDLFRGDSNGSQRQIKHAVHVNQEEAGLAILSSDSLANHYFSIFAEITANAMNRFSVIHKSILRMWQIEHPVPFGKLAYSRMIGTLAIALSAVAPLGGDNPYKRKLLSPLSIRMAMLKSGLYLLSVQILGKLGGPGELGGLLIKASQIAENEMGGSTVVQILDELASRGVLGPSEISLVLADQLDQSKFAMLLSALAVSALKNILPVVTEEHQTGIQLIQSNPDSNQTFLKIGDFQETYLKQRIAAHAARVAEYNLAAAPLVIEDIEETIGALWTMLPPGFGSETSTRD
ncbi:hypothetical protein FRC12_024183 [Ceratobasidium sp. 428]|nr:hypothetical protein FRC12_024183 [Ceratobasidium sp. 428]